LCRGDRLTVDFFDYADFVDSFSRVETHHTCLLSLRKRDTSMYLYKKISVINAITLISGYISASSRTLPFSHLIMRDGKARMI
jgi:hypothetical protein